MGFNVFDRVFVTFLAFMVAFEPYKFNEGEVQLAFSIGVLVFGLAWEILSENLGYRVLEYFRGEEN